MRRVVCQRGQTHLPLAVLRLPSTRLFRRGPIPPSAWMVSFTCQVEVAVLLQFQCNLWCVQWDTHTVHSDGRRPPTYLPDCLVLGRGREDHGTQSPYCSLGNVVNAAACSLQKGLRGGEGVSVCNGAREPVEGVKVRRVQLCPTPAHPACTSVNSLMVVLSNFKVSTWSNSIQVRKSTRLKRAAHACIKTTWGH